MQPAWRRNVPQNGKEYLRHNETNNVSQRWVAPEDSLVQIDLDLCNQCPYDKYLNYMVSFRNIFFNSSSICFIFYTYQVCEWMFLDDAQYMLLCLEISKYVGVIINITIVNVKIICGFWHTYITCTYTHCQIVSQFYNWISIITGSLLVHTQVDMFHIWAVV